MIRGTTAQFKFSLPYDYDDLVSVKIGFWQPGNPGTASNPLPFYKYLDDCVKLKPRELSVTLSQLETLRFSAKSKAYVQLSATTEGECFASKREMITVYPIYDDTTMGDIIVTSEDDDGYIVLDGQSVTTA